jgi:hypothetical protein
VKNCAGRRRFAWRLGVDVYSYLTDAFILQFFSAPYLPLFFNLQGIGGSELPISRPVDPVRFGEQNSLDVSYIGLAACNCLHIGFDLIGI